MAVGTLWRNNAKLCSDLDGVLAMLREAPTQLEDWLNSTAFEGARQVLAGVRACYPEVALGLLVREVPIDRDLETYFEEVSEEAEFAAGACVLQEISKRVERDVNNS